LIAYELTAIMRKQVTFQGGLIWSVANVMRNQTATRPQRLKAEAEEAESFRVVEMVHQPHCERDVERAKLLNLLMADPAADELATIAISPPS
jgi:hypothetical protein